MNKSQFEIWTLLISIIFSDCASGFLVSITKCYIYSIQQKGVHPM